MEKPPQLPEEIIADILSRLPVKHLMQLKCLSKPWKSLISAPQFAKLHLEAQSLNYRVLLLTRPLQSAACEASADDLRDIERNLILELPFPAAMKKTPDSDELIKGFLDSGGSCNGLVCSVFDQQRIFLWNPTIREAKELTKLSVLGPKGTFKFNYGLGHDSSTDDYKIIRIAVSFIANASDETQVEVLTLKSNIWRRIQGLPPGIEIKGHDAGIFLHGAVHWLAATNKIGARKTYGVIAFDISEEKFHELVPIPDQIEGTFYNTLDLGLSRDCLCLFYICGNEYVFEAWLLQEYGIKSSWTRLFKVLDINYGPKLWEKALCYTNSGKVMIDCDASSLLWYDPKENTSKSSKPRKHCACFSPVIIFTESMVSPNCCSAANV